MRENTLIEYLKKLYNDKITKTGKWYKLEVCFKKQQRKERYLLDELRVQKMVGNTSKFHSFIN